MNALLKKLATSCVLVCSQQIVFGMDGPLYDDMECAARQLAKNQEVSLPTARLLLGQPGAILEQAIKTAKNRETPIIYALDRLLTLRRRGESEGRQGRH
jgi:hypothetical protein